MSIVVGATQSRRLCPLWAAAYHIMVGGVVDTQRRYVKGVAATFMALGRG